MHTNISTFGSWKYFQCVEVEKVRYIGVCCWSIYLRVVIIFIDLLINLSASLKQWLWWFAKRDGNVNIHGRNSHLPVFEDELSLNTCRTISINQLALDCAQHVMQSCRHMKYRTAFLFCFNRDFIRCRSFSYFAVDTMIEAKGKLTQWIRINYVGYLIKIVFIFYLCSNYTSVFMSLVFVTVCGMIVDVVCCCGMSSSSSSNGVTLYANAKLAAIYTAYILSITNYSTFYFMRHTHKVIYAIHTHASSGWNAWYIIHHVGVLCSNCVINGISKSIHIAWKSLNSLDIVGAWCPTGLVFCNWYTFFPVTNNKNNLQLSSVHSRDRGQLNWMDQQKQTHYV